LKSFNWGYPGQNGVTMPGPGKTTPGTRGEGFLDIHLNTTTRWKEVPENIWQYTLGGYHVPKKWPSYRDQAHIHRPLTPGGSPGFHPPRPPRSCDPQAKPRAGYVSARQLGDDGFKV
jgi:hypothetical protein